MSTETKLQITGMHCQACVNRVRMALGKVDGVKVLDVAVGAARIETADPAAAAAAVTAAGYPARPE